MKLSDLHKDDIKVESQPSQQVAQLKLSDIHPDDIQVESMPKDSWLDKEVPMVGGTPRGYIQGGLNTLPLAGMVGGGIVGGAGGSVIAPGPGTAEGAILFSGVGGATGKALKNLGEKYILGKNPEKSIVEDAGEGFNEGALNESGGALLGKGIGKVAEIPLVQKAGGLLKRGFTKTAETLTGIPEQITGRYISDAKDIKDMSKAYDNNTAEGADALREGWGQNTQAFKKDLNNQISTTLEGSNKTIEAEPILDALEKAKAKINPKLNPEQIEQIDALKDKVLAVVDKRGTLPQGLMEVGFHGNPPPVISAKDAHDLKEFLSEFAKPSYGPTGQIFAKGTKVENAAKAGAAVTRKALNEAEPAIADANNKLWQLHQIEDGMNRNMLKEGKPEASILAAGSGGNPRNKAALEELGNLTGQDMIGDAEKLAAMRTFGKPALLPIDHTGKSLTRMGLGAGLGWLAGPVLGEGHTGGAMMGAALTSPMALRTAIDSGLLTKDLAQNLMETPGGKGLLANALRKGAKGLLDLRNYDNQKPMEQAPLLTNAQ